jgi:hypothetical protein
MKTRDCLGAESLTRIILNNEARAAAGEIPRLEGSPREVARPAQPFGSLAPAPAPAPAAPAAPAPKRKPRRLSLARPNTAPASLHHSSSCSCRILRRVIFAALLIIGRPPLAATRQADGPLSVASTLSSFRLPALPRHLVYLTPTTRDLSTARSTSASQHALWHIPLRRRLASPPRGALETDVVFSGQFSNRATPPKSHVNHVQQPVRTPSRQLQAGRSLS